MDPSEPGTFLQTATSSLLYSQSQKYVVLILEIYRRVERIFFQSCYYPSGEKPKG